MRTDNVPDDPRPNPDQEHVMYKTYGVISGELTGRQPIFVDRQSVHEVEVHGATITLHLAGAGERIVLTSAKRRPEGTLQAVVEAVFPQDSLAMSEELRLLTRRSINPAAIQLLDWVGGKVVVVFRDGKTVEFPGAEIERYHQIVSVLCGSSAAELVKTVAIAPVAPKIPERRPEPKVNFSAFTPKRQAEILASADRAIALSGNPARIGGLVDEVCGTIQSLRPGLDDSQAAEKEGVLDTMALLDARRKELGSLVGQLLTGSSEPFSRVGALARDIAAIVQRLEVRGIETRKEIIRQCQRLTSINSASSEQAAPKAAWPPSILAQ